MKPITIARGVLCATMLVACQRPASSDHAAQAADSTPSVADHAAANQPAASHPSPAATTPSPPPSSASSLPAASNVAPATTSQAPPATTSQAAAPIARQAPALTAEQASMVKEAMAQPDMTTRQSALVDALKQMPVATAADLALTKLSHDAGGEHILGQYLADAAIKDPAQTAAWLVQAGDFPAKNQAIRRTADYWQHVDFAATMQWASQLADGVERDQALYPIAAHIRMCSDEQRKQSLDAITNASLRKSVENLLNTMAPDQ